MFELVKMPGQHRERWMHAAQPRPGGRPPSAGSGASGRKAYQLLMHVTTDEGVEGICTALNDGASHLDRHDLEQLKLLVIGADPFDRELLYQKLNQGTRWLYRAPGWFGTFDNCLWDIAGKVAGLPVYALLGRARERENAGLLQHSRHEHWRGR
jgi:L-alanine-DL-glutamate epimerase-like enolase superfamily enzyme